MEGSDLNQKEVNTRKPGTVERLAALVDGERRGQRVNGYEMLPGPEWVQPTVAYVLSIPEGQIKSVSTFCYNLRIWSTHDGLTLDELRTIYREMKRPHRMAQLRFGEGEHLRMFAEMVHEACKQRRLEAAKRERELRAQMYEEQRRNEPELIAEALRKLLSSIPNKGTNEPITDTPGETA
jgi:hypothetical protein